MKKHQLQFPFWRHDIQKNDTICKWHGYLLYFILYVYVMISITTELYIFGVG
jgi:hypothetical protein